MYQLRRPLYNITVVEFKRSEVEPTEKGLMLNDDEIIIDQFGQQVDNVWDYRDAGQLRIDVAAFFQCVGRLNSNDTSLHVDKPTR